MYNETAKTPSKSNRNANLTEVFHVKPPVKLFSFLPPVSFEIFTAGFSSRIFIFPLAHWLKKSDYSSLPDAQCNN